MEDEESREDSKSKETLSNSGSNGMETGSDCPRIKTNKKISRKIGEKHRRDRINKHIHSLSEEIPWAVATDHRLDKSQILRLTVSYLKLHNGLKKKRKCAFLPRIITKDTLQTFLQEVSTGGFIIIVSQCGNLLYASKSITELLGHSVVDLIGKPVYKIIHQDDQDLFKAQFDTGHTHISSQTNSSKFDSLAPVSTFKNRQRSFAIRMQTLFNDKDKNQFEYVHMVAHVRNNQWSSNSKENKHSALDEMWMTAFGKVLKDESIHHLSLMDMNKLEFCSQHGMDGSILFIDQRVAQCLGELPSEKIGFSCYDSIDPDDLQAVAVSHMKIMTDGEVPSTFFRLHPPHGRTVYIQSRSVVVKDMWTKEPKFISSINIVITKEEGDKMLKQQRKKVEALIAMTKGLSLQTDELSSETCSNLIQSGSNECLTHSASSNGSVIKSSQSRVSNTPLLKSLLLRCDSPEQELSDVTVKDTNEIMQSTSKPSTLNPVSTVNDANCWSALSLDSCLTDTTSDANQSSYNQIGNSLPKNQSLQNVSQKSIAHSNISWMATEDTMDTTMDFDCSSQREILKMDHMSSSMMQDFHPRSHQSQSGSSATSAGDNSMSLSPVSTQSSFHNTVLSPDLFVTRNESVGSVSSFLPDTCVKSDLSVKLSQRCGTECEERTKQGRHSSTDNTVGNPCFTSSSTMPGRGDNLSISGGTGSYESLSSSRTSAAPVSIPCEEKSDLLLPMDTGNIMVSIDNPAPSDASNIPQSKATVSLPNSDKGITKGEDLNGIYHKWCHQLHDKHSQLDQVLHNQRAELGHLHDSFNQVQHAKSLPGTQYGNLTQKLQMLQSSVDDQRAFLNELKEEHRKNLHKNELHQDIN